MSTYKAIKGQNIRVVSSDPSNLALGDIWYNSTSNLLKVVAQQASWSLTGDISTGRCMCFTGGTKDAGWIAGGRPGNQTVSQDWDGTSFAVGNSLNTGANSGGKAGLYNSGLRAAGNGTGAGTTSEEYDGTTWTAGGTIPTSGLPRSRTYGCAGSGLQDAAWVASGGPGGEGTPGWTTAFKYDGTSWSSTGATQSIRWVAAACGTESAGLFYGGYNYASASTNTEHYNGSVFSEENNMPSGRNTWGGAGTQSAAGGAGGAPGYSNNYFLYDGTNWSTGSTMPTPVMGSSMFGADNQNVVVGGSAVPGGYTTQGFSYIDAESTVSITTS